MVTSMDNWDEIVDGVLRDGTIPSEFNNAQKQMLVPALRKRGMRHKEALWETSWSERQRG